MSFKQCCVSAKLIVSQRVVINASVSKYLKSIKIRSTLFTNPTCFNHEANDVQFLNNKQIRILHLKFEYKESLDHKLRTI